MAVVTDVPAEALKPNNNMGAATANDGPRENSNTTAERALTTLMNKI